MLSQLPDPSKAVLVAVLVPLIYHGLVAAFSLLGRAATFRRGARPARGVVAAGRVDEAAPARLTAGRG